MAYPTQGSAPPMEDSIHAHIFIAASSARLRESAIRDRLMALVIPLAMF